MKALIVNRPDGEFDLQSIPTPEPQPGYVLVKIKAACINPLDIKIRAGAAAHAKQPLPAVLGLDMAGGGGEGGGGGKRIKRGGEGFWMTGGVGGLQGSLAELVAADASLLAHKPKRLSMREAAALPLSSITAWEGL